MSKEKSVPSTETQVVGWIYEDELPKDYPYDAMFPHSKVDGVRMFPVFAPAKNMEDVATKYPSRFVITGLVAKDSEALKARKGDRVWLYWSPEGGGWWQWGPEGWAYRFEAKSGRKYEDAIVSAKGAGPYYNVPDSSTIETVAVPAIVTVS